MVSILILSIFEEGSPSAIAALQGAHHLTKKIHDIKPFKIKERERV